MSRCSTKELKHEEKPGTSIQQWGYRMDGVIGKGKRLIGDWWEINMGKGRYEGPQNLAENVRLQQGAMGIL